MKDASKFFDAISKFAVVEWGRFSTNEVENDEVYCPINVWRFDPNKTDSFWAEEIISTLDYVLRNFKGNVQWTLEKPGDNINGNFIRNYVLIPTKFKEICERFRIDTEARTQLYKDDPDLGPKAYEDLAEIAKSLDYHLSVLAKNKP